MQANTTPVLEKHNLEYNEPIKTVTSTDDIFTVPAISLKTEAQAYENLWSEPGTSYKSVHEQFKGNNKLPSDYIHQLIDNKEVSKKITEKNPNVMCRNTKQFSKEFSKMKYPLALYYYDGYIDATLDTKKLISIVGTRNPTQKAIENTKSIVRYLVSVGYTIVSGLARGIDTVALETAINANGRVIAVIGTPIDEYYPKENKRLQDTIGDSHTLISHVPFYRYSVQPFMSKKYYFTERNSIMGAMSRATIIIEVSETSGTRSQARECAYMGKELFFLNDSFEKREWVKKYVNDKKAKVLKTLKDVRQCMD